MSAPSQVPSARHRPVLLDDKRIPDDLKDIARFRLEERGASL